MTAYIASCRAALELFNCNEASFKAPQLEQLGQSTPEQLRLWKKLSAQVHQDVEVGLAPRRRLAGLWACQHWLIGRSPFMHVAGGEEGDKRDGIQRGAGAGLP